MRSTDVHRIAVVVSHPIQHFCPQYKSWSKLQGVELMVFFASKSGLTPYVDPQFGRTIQWAGLELDFPHQFLPGAAEREPHARIDCLELDVELQKFAPHVVVSYGYAQPLQRRAARWASRNNCSLFMISDSELRERRGLPKRFAKKMIIPRVLRRFDLMLTVGDANEQYYQHYGVDVGKLVRCPFPIDTRAFDAVYSIRDEARRSLRADLSIPDDHIVLLMVGKIIRWKRQIDLATLSNLWAEGRPLTVILAGTGPDQQEIERVTKVHGAGGVVFTGFVQPHDLVRYYAATDVYVHCSEIDRHSLAISEAIYMGLPVITSDRTGSYGPTDDVQPGRNGFVYECGNVDALMKLIKVIVDDPVLLSDFSKASRKIAVDNQALAHGEAMTQALRRLAVE